MTQVSPEIQGFIAAELFNTVPVSICVIDRQRNIVHANERFLKVFGEWRGRKCYQVNKAHEEPCENCFAAACFQDGQPRQVRDFGYNQKGRPAHYIKHSIPIHGPEGSISYLVEMYLDITDKERLRMENEMLFEQVPCNMTVLDKDLNIVRANRRVRDKFGNVLGKRCFEVFRQDKRPCKECPTRRTFEDAQVHIGQSVVQNSRGDQFSFQVTTAPIELDGEDYVLEMAVNITESLDLRDQLNIAHAFLETIVVTSMDGIVAIDSERNVIILNPAARKLLGLGPQDTLLGGQLCSMLPVNFFNQVQNAGPYLYRPNATLTNLVGESLSVRLVGVKLENAGKLLGLAFFLQDQSKLKALEREKLEAERMAAVGQTVAGLAHGIKNLLTGLDGGMYMVRTGLRKDNRKRIEKGTMMLDRNLERIGAFVKDFLRFAKGRFITPEPCDPASVVHDVAEVYQNEAKKHNIALETSIEHGVEPANLDDEGMHEALMNLVGNALDACRMSDRKQRHRVSLRLFEADEVLTFEVKDNGCGMNEDVQRKAFHSFFTTKDLGGTGLGLLTTRRLIQEHGGEVDFVSEEGKGTTFTIRLPRERLPFVKP